LAGNVSATIFQMKQFLMAESGEATASLPPP
jgi:hypothetical protein